MQVRLVLFGNGKSYHIVRDTDSQNKMTLQFPRTVMTLRYLTTCESTLRPGAPSALGIICFTPVTEEGWTVTKDSTVPEREM